jgi:hypothetical protein
MAFIGPLTMPQPRTSGIFVPSSSENILQSWEKSSPVLCIFLSVSDKRFINNFAEVFWVISCTIMAPSPRCLILLDSVKFLPRILCQFWINLSRKMSFSIFSDQSVNPLISTKRISAFKLFLLIT